MNVRPSAFWGGGLLWLMFLFSPLAVGMLLEQLFDALGREGPAMLLLAAVAGIEVMRATLLPAVGWVFMPFFGAAETVLRTNVLGAQLDPDPAERGPVIEDAGAALPLFREDVQHLTRAADVWQTVVSVAVLALGIMVVIARIDVFVALAMAVPLVAATGVGYLLAPMVRRRRAEDRAVTSEVTGFMGEVFGAVGTVTTSGAAPAVLQHLAGLCDRRRVTAVRDRVAEQLLPAVGASSADLALALGLLAAALLVGADLSPGQVALLAAYAALLAGFPRYWAEWLTVRRHADVAVARLRGTVRDGEVDRLIAPIPTVHIVPPPVARYPLPPAPTAPHIEVRALVVRAPDGRLLGPFDLQVPAGGVAAVTGQVGTGKSTLLRGILGLVPLVDGEVRWNGEVIDPSRFMVPPRSAYVAQVPMLFSETLDENLRLGWDVADELLHGVLGYAAVGELVASLEQGLATRLGPRGTRLSGGQAHRVAAARALVAGSAFVVADDLSAALDATTEATLLDRLLGARTRTLLVVSHRPAVLERADVVLDLDVDVDTT